ncbi:M14 family metallopeptidase [Vibrio hepatarius]|uniref:M14 family metallopeptidase n=1 Tax=Vibrio hepatarius TaxID=171383 RepID=UPI001C096153|nr:M14 family metallocarboxypeptidase [Vibrio hepatarius]MBU2899051.1 M14 family metallocarboxypeptidase [Vibrio hepatarius]
MQAKEFYPIGITGKKWQDAEYQLWRNQTSVKRNYQQEVVTKIHALADRFKVEQYGALSYDSERYPLFCIKSNSWESNKPVVLITGGVHGYETSGVHGALQFVDTQMENYSRYFNIIVAPCISPWGYETINRWNPLAIDPNRSFFTDSPAEESANLIKLVNTIGQAILVHFDLHETTDTDETEFRPALAARDGADFTPGTIPDGFYTVGNSENPQSNFQAAVIQSVSLVTHIAPADKDGKIIGSQVTQEGVINYPMVKLGLCGGVANCTYSTTTEVYPDSSKVTAEQCNQAQVAAIKGGLDYVLTKI